MQRKLSNCLCFLGLLLYFGAGNAYQASAQNPAQQKANEDTCADLYYWIEQEYLQGHYLVVDSLVKEYSAQGCYTIDPRHTIDVLRMVRKQRLEDNYRKNEADSIQKTIDSKTEELRIGSRYDGYTLRIGGGTTLNYPFSIDYINKYDATKFGSVSGHASLGYRFDIRKIGSNITYWAVDAEYCYQRIAFSFKAINNKDDNNNNLADGFVLKTNGYNEFHKFGALISRNKEPLYSGFGYGVFVGIEALETWTTHIYHYYYEYGYQDSVVPLSGSSARVYSSYNVFSGNDLDNANFFSNDFLFNIPAGFNIYGKFKGRLLGTVSLFGSAPLGKLSLSGINYSRDIGYFGMKFTASVLLIKKQVPGRKPRH